LHAAGVRPEGKAVYELANGQPIEYEYGFARIAFFGGETVTQVIFGPSDVEPILGAVALENVGVVVDPVTRGLKRLHAKPLK
jgi:predicted aspartyl protease